VLRYAQRLLCAHGLALERVGALNPDDQAQQRTEHHAQHGQRDHQLHDAEDTRPPRAGVSAHFHARPHKIRM
jgi:hypothetical protein